MLINPQSIKTHPITIYYTKKKRCPARSSLFGGIQSINIEIPKKNLPLTPPSQPSYASSGQTGAHPFKVDRTLLLSCFEPECRPPTDWEGVNLTHCDFKRMENRTDTMQGTELNLGHVRYTCTAQCT